MKKILSLFIVLASVFSIFACSDNKKYEPIASTEEEAVTVMTFEADGEKYEVRYELYRALFLTYSSQYDNGDKSFWNTPSANDAKTEINKKIISFAADIYATLHHAKKLDLDPYSKSTDEKIDEYITNSVDGVEGTAIEGFGGDYDAYLASLREMNLNYSVQALILRYSIAYNDIVTYYIGTIDEDAPTLDMEEGHLSYTKDDVYNFYMSDECARVSTVEINSLYMSDARIQAIRDTLAGFSDTESALNYAIGNTAADDEYVKNGRVIGTESMDKAYYAEVISSAFSLGINETSQPIKITTDASSESWILYKREKNDTHFNDCYDEIEAAYLSQEIGLKLSNIKEALVKSTITTQFFDTLEYSTIKMNES